MAGAKQTSAEKIAAEARARALVEWLDANGVELQDEMAVMVSVPAQLLRDLRKSYG